MTACYPWSWTLLYALHPVQSQLTPWARWCKLQAIVMSDLTTFLWIEFTPYKTNQMALNQPNTWYPGKFSSKCCKKRCNKITQFCSHFWFENLCVQQLFVFSSSDHLNASTITTSGCVIITFFWRKFFFTWNYGWVQFGTFWRSTQALPLMDKRYYNVKAQA